MENLNSKWWHRFFKVLFVVVIIATLGISYFVASSSIENTFENTDITITLTDYTKNHPELVNTVPSFLEKNGTLACKNDATRGYDYLSDFSLKNYAVCNNDITTNIDKVFTVLQSLDPAVKNTAKDSILQSHIQNSKDSYCLGNKKYFSCGSTHVVKYIKNYIFYWEAVGYAVLTTIIVSLVLLLVYFKGFIYIIYGKKK